MFPRPKPDSRPPEPSYSRRGRIFMAMVQPLKKLLSRFDGAFDPLYPAALLKVNEVNDYSISFLQRHFRIGYSRAVRLNVAVVSAIFPDEVAMKKED